MSLMNWRYNCVHVAAYTKSKSSFLSTCIHLDHAYSLLCCAEQSRSATKNASSGLVQHAGWCYLISQYRGSNCDYTTWMSDINWMFCIWIRQSWLACVRLATATRAAWKASMLRIGYFLPIAGWMHSRYRFVRPAWSGELCNECSKCDNGKFMILLDERNYFLITNAFFQFFPYPLNASRICHVWGPHKNLIFSTINWGCFFSIESHPSLGSCIIFTYSVYEPLTLFSYS